MNVLGKIKSKKPKPEQNSKHSQHISQTLEKPPAFQSQVQQPPLKNHQSFQSKHQFDMSKKTKSSKPVFEAEFIMNTNVISKQKQAAIKQQDPGLLRTFDSGCSNFSTLFQTKKESKKMGVYFDQIPSVRSNSFVSNQVSKDKDKQTNQEDSILNDDSFSLDFDFLLSQRQKKQIKKNLYLSRGKAQNAKEIQEDLKAENNQVLSFLVKKWNFYGDLYMFEGELESLKRKFIIMEVEEKETKVYDRIKVKISCGSEIIVSPETIGRMYMSEVIFVSENQAIITPEHLLKTVEKGRKRGRKD